MTHHEFSTDPCLTQFPGYGPILALAITPVIEAQSSEMPVPLAIVVDADGKPMVQIVDINPTTVQVLFNFDSDPVMAHLYWRESSFTAEEVFFSQDNCAGDVFLYPWHEVYVLHYLNQREYTITGPDGTDGTYRVFRTTSNSPGAVFPESRLETSSTFLGRCVDLPGSQLVLVTGEEVLPNPLEGFHGPTLANPDRLLTIKGGTRLP